MFDACLIDSEEDNYSLCSIHTGMQDAEPLVEALVQNLHDDWGAKVHHEDNLGCAEHISKRAKVSSAENPINSKGINLSADDCCRKDLHKQWKQRSKGRSKYPYRRKVFPSVVGLKKIARLSEEDRLALIRFLKKSRCMKREKKSPNSGSRNRQGTSLSAGSRCSGKGSDSKEFSNWLTLHGDKKQAENDVKKVGEIIGVACSNSFGALSRGGGRVKKVEAKQSGSGGGD
jgi:hypothetical protein